MGFEAKYLNRTPEGRDRFQIEFNQEERKLFLDAQIFIQQHKDATALKQLAFLGWFAISSPDKFNRYFKDTLFKNFSNNRRLGVNVDLEISDKIQRIKDLTGWKL